MNTEQEIERVVKEICSIYKAGEGGRVQVTPWGLYFFLKPVRFADRSLAGWRCGMGELDGHTYDHPKLQGDLEGVVKVFIEGVKMVSAAMDAN